MANAQNVSVGKPVTAGAISVAPVGTSLPTDTTTALTGFKNLGYVSEDGLTNGTNIDSSKIKAWGGDTVLVVQTSKEDTFAFTLIEVLNEDVLKFVYGENNVTGALSTGLTVKANSGETEEVSIVIDMILRNNTAKRIVIPYAKISAVDDIQYTDDGAVGYKTTVDCTPDGQGNTHYEYIKNSTYSA